jgi:archaellum component FlaC
VDGIDGRLEETNTRLDGITNRVDGIDGRLEETNTRLDGITNRVDGIDSRLEGIDGRLAGIDSRLDETNRRLEEQHTETRRHTSVLFEEVISRIELIGEGRATKKRRSH